jgi:alkylation response protein AidB-like acyl-CoA dehydrogenase
MLRGHLAGRRPQHADPRRLGITDDTIVARLFREVRPFRIYDGPSEVHRWSIAQRVLRNAGGS